MDSLIKIGEIVAPQGVKGEVRVVPLTDYPERFLDLSSVIVAAGERYRTEELPRTEIESVRFHKQFVLLKFKGIDCIDLAEGLRKKYLYILPEERVALPAETYYYDQIIGLQVMSGTELLGVVEDILRTGSNDVYVIKTNELTKKGKNKKLLLPALKSLILNIDLDNKKMQVNFPEELR